MPIAGSAGTPSSGNAVASASEGAGGVGSTADSTAVVSADAAPEKTAAKPGNLHLELGQVLQKKQQKEVLEDRRKALLQGLTDQLKVVMARISDPKITDRN